MAKKKNNKKIEVIIKNGKQKKGKEFKVSNNEQLKKVAEYLRLYLYQKNLDDIDLMMDISFKLDGKKISAKELKVFLQENIDVKKGSIKNTIDKKSKKTDKKKKDKSGKKKKKNTKKLKKSEDGNKLVLHIDRLK